MKKNDLTDKLKSLLEKIIYFEKIYTSNLNLGVLSEQTIKNINIQRILLIKENLSLIYFPAINKLPEESPIISENTTDIERFIHLEFKRLNQKLLDLSVFFNKKMKIIASNELIKDISLEETSLLTNQRKYAALIAELDMKCGNIKSSSLFPSDGQLIQNLKNINQHTANYQPFVALINASINKANLLGEKEKCLLEAINGLEAFRDVYNDIEAKIRQRLKERIAIKSKYTNAKERLNLILDIKIANQVRAFMHLYKQAYQKMEKYGSNKEKIDEIKQQFDVINQKNCDGCEKTKLLHDIYIKLERQVILSQAVICQKIIGNLDEIILDLNISLKAILKDINLSDFQLTANEIEVINRVKIEFYHVNYKNINGSPAQLEVLKNGILRQIKIIKVNIASAQSIINMHQRAKKMIGQDGFTLFIEEVNNHQRSTRLFTTFKQYLVESHEFLLKINANLSQFNISSLPLLADFLNEFDDGTAIKIKEKLEFIKILYNKGITYQYFLDNVSVQTAVKLLYTNNLTHLITHENLKNSLFCDTLMVLNINKISLSAEIVTVLQHDPDKCSVINYQYELNKTSNLALDDAIFKALIMNFIHVPTEIAKAINLIKNQDPKFCQPWLLIYAQYNNDLVSILSVPKNIANNMIILKIIMGNTAHLNTFVPDYLSNNPEYKKIAQKIMEVFFKRWECNFKLLLKANEEPAIQLEKMARLIKEIDRFSTHYKTKNTEVKQSLQQFTLAVIPILMTAKTLEEKKEELTLLAKSSFHHRQFNQRLLMDVLQCITGTFLIIMPIRYFGFGKNPFFSYANTQRQVEFERNVLANVTEISNRNEEALIIPREGYTPRH